VQQVPAAGAVDLHCNKNTPCLVLLPAPLLPSPLASCNNNQPTNPQRKELIGAVDFAQRQQRFASEQEVLTAGQDVTASLRRTQQLMRQNLEQTHGNISVIGACRDCG
jgi:hypothetical protein